MPAKKVPDFSAPATGGAPFRLSDHKGKAVVLYFYPKDNTPGCTKQACVFKEAYDGFKADDIAVIGISKDSSQSHQKFAEKYELPFILLSDPDLQVIKAYDVWQEKKLYGKTSLGVVRSTYVIDENGVIIKVFEKAKPDTNAYDILDFLGK
jgi:peroxiredoxin Q/BCP